MLMFGIAIGTIIVVGILQVVAFGLKLNPKRERLGKILDVVSFAVVANIAYLLFNNNEVLMMIVLIMAYFDLRIFSEVELNNKEG